MEVLEGWGYNVYTSGSATLYILAGVNVDLS
jgi:hypothetical protein